MGNTACHSILSRDSNQGRRAMIALICIQRYSICFSTQRSKFIPSLEFSRRRDNFLQPNQLIFRSVKKRSAFTKLDGHSCKGIFHSGARRWSRRCLSC